MQAQDFSNCRLTKSHEFLSSSRLLASSPTPMMPRDSAKDSSLRGDTSPPAGEALLQTAGRWLCGFRCGCSKLCRAVWAVSGVRIPLFFTGVCDGPVCTVGRTLRCFWLGRFSGSLRHGRRNHWPLQLPGPRGKTGHNNLDYRVVRTAICCVPMETRHKNCCLIIFSPSSSQDVGSRSFSSLGVPFTFGRWVLFRSD